jgi:hypothetical protein
MKFERLFICGIVVLLPVLAWVGTVVKERHAAEREAEIRRIATEVACRTIVEAKLVRSCTPVQQ